jgi:glycosyl transferase family 2/polyribitol phosphate beta-O-GlcNActransferase TarS-like protein
VSPSRDGSRIEVSVVVPAYNAGAQIDRLVRSLTGQTLDPSELELLFVDDGSTDGTAERLDEVARTATNARVVHIDASGAPGRPRNVGLAQARGRWVTFVDADDELFPDALRTMSRYGDRHRSDIVVGHVTSTFRERSQTLFATAIPRCTLRSTPRLIGMSAAPGKLFRTAFVHEHQLAFPEGWRRFEDQLFAVRAYLAARAISVLPVPVYHYVERPDHANLTAQPLEARDYEHLAEVVRAIRMEVEPGLLRDRLLVRIYRVEILRDLTAWIAASDESQSESVRAVFDAARRVAVDLGDGPAAWLGPILRPLAHALVGGDVPGFVELARGVAGIMFTAVASEVRRDDTRLRIGWAADLASDNMVLPIENSATADVVLRNADSAIEVAARTRVLSVTRSGANGVPDGAAPGRHGVEAGGVAHLDLERLLRDHRLGPGAWTAGIRLSYLNVAGRADLSVRAQDDCEDETVVLPRAGLGVTVYGSSDGLLRVLVEPIASAIARARPVAAAVAGRGVTVALSTGLEGRGWRPLSIGIRIVASAPPVRATVVAIRDRLAVRVPALPDMPDGSYTLSASLPAGPDLGLGTLSVTNGRATVADLPAFDDRGWSAREIVTRNLRAGGRSARDRARAARLDTLRALETLAWRLPDRPRRAAARIALTIRRDPRARRASGD